MIRFLGVVPLTRDTIKKEGSDKQSIGNSTTQRKSDHIRICLTEDVQALHKKPGFEDVELVHNALPEMNIEDVNIGTELFGRKLRAPLVIAGMTGGHPIAMRINAVLAELAQETGIGMGVGSQRAAIENSSLAETYSVVRKVAPDALVIANVGAPQLAKGYGVIEAKKAVEMIEADALAIHLNPLQEAVQLEGETSTREVLNRIGVVAEQLEVPVVAKETGCGIAYEEAYKLAKVHVKGIDVGGAGGTSWSAVEAYRELGHETRRTEGEHLGFMFRDWGIPTAVSIVEVSAVKELKIIATGGVRNGIDVAKAIALGANVAGIALPFLKPAYAGDKDFLRVMVTGLIREIKTAMYLTGATDLKALTKTNLVLKGETAQWLEMRGFDPKRYSKRRTLDSS
jgi:isopentenyl-diphosphate delta-isomerase